jgi:hypothetical protein
MKRIGKVTNVYWRNLVLGAAAALCTTAGVGCAGGAGPGDDVAVEAASLPACRENCGEVAYRAIFLGAGADAARLPRIWDRSTAKVRQSKEYLALVDRAAKETAAKYPRLFAEFGKEVSSRNPNIVARAIRDAYRAFVDAVTDPGFDPGNVGQDIWKTENIAYTKDVVYDTTRIIHGTENIFDDPLEFDVAIAQITQSFAGFDGGQF